MRTVLILEDDELVARRVANAMREAGWQVLAAASSQQAFTMGRLFSVDLVIADVLLHEGSGVDVVQRIAAIRPSLEVLYISRHSRWQLERLLPQGRFAFLQTPFDPSDLVDAVAALVPAFEHVLAETA